MKYIIFLILSAIMILNACTATDDACVELTLDSGWEFRQAGESQWRTATVPGSVHSDLLQQGLIPDMFYRANEDSIQWIERVDWEYRTRFTPDAALRRAGYVELDFKGLDTYADVYLNDSLILQADNMFIAWQVPVSGLLRQGENELRIYFRSPVNVGLEKLRQLPYLLKATNEQAPEDERTNIFTRKAPFHYGWDWGPRLVTSGIWRPVHLRAWSLAAIEDIYIEKISVSPERAEYKAHLNVKAEQAGEYGARLVVQGLAGEFSQSARMEPGVHTLTIPFSIENPSLWWTAGLGEPHLYSLDIDLYSGNRKIDGRSQRIGVRDIQLVQEPDEIGRSFRFELNGVPVFMKGANYIPSHTITPMVTPEVYSRVIADAVAANMNMLRVWGGAIYEEDLFYDLCDENGILIWQDFMFACALMPADEQHWDNIRKEAEYNVRRLRNHPSMALWCGNNENLTAWHHWGWKEAYPDSISQVLWNGYDKIFHQILRQAVAEHHPELTYWSSSPSSYIDRLPDRKSGDEHDWTIWFGQAPYENYLTNVPRFVSEYGLQAYPEVKTLRSVMEDGDLEWNSPMMDRRQRSRMDWITPGFSGNGMILRYLERYYPSPVDFAEVSYLSQLSQALAWRYAIEGHRRAMPWCMGSLYWQINDCWPTVSWASVDYYGTWKASHYMARRSFEPVLVTGYLETGRVNVHAVSDRLEELNGILRLELMDFDGTVLKTEDIPFAVQNSSVRVLSRSVTEVLSGRDPRRSVLRLRLMQGEEVLAANNMLFTLPKNIDLPEVQIGMQAVREGSDWLLTLQSDSLAKDVYLSTEKEGRFSDNFFDLLPGETVEVRLSATDVADPDAEISVRCLNGLEHYR